MSPPAPAYPTGQFNTVVMKDLASAFGPDPKSHANHLASTTTSTPQIPVRRHHTLIKDAMSPEPAFLREIPPIPEDEFAVYGTVMLSFHHLERFFLTTQVYAHIEYADALEAVYTETTRLAASEEGIIYYCISRDGSNPSIFHFFERYTGKKAFEEHNSQPIIQKLLHQDRYIKDVKAVFVKPITGN